MTNKELKKRFKKMKAVDPIYFELKTIIRKNDKREERQADDAGSAFSKVFDFDDVRYPMEIDFADRLTPSRESSIEKNVKHYNARDGL